MTVSPSFSEKSDHLSSSGPGGSDQLRVVHVCSQLSVPLQPQLQILLPLLQTHRSQQPLGLQEHHRETAGTRLHPQMHSQRHTDVQLVGLSVTGETVSVYEMK